MARIDIYVPTWYKRRNELVVKLHIYLYDISMIFPNIEIVILLFSVE